VRTFAPTAYPNPANDRLFLANLPAHSLSEPFALVDAAGRTVISGTARMAGSGVDIGQLAPGAYMLRMNGCPTLRVTIAR
jgi:hypothetical protein